MQGRSGHTPRTLAVCPVVRSVSSETSLPRFGSQLHLPAIQPKTSLLTWLDLSFLKCKDVSRSTS